MNDIIPAQADQLVSLHGDHPITTSLIIAHAFGKRHRDILRAIRNLECSAGFNARNFAPVGYIDEKGEPRAAYEITKNGFAFLVMGFTGIEGIEGVTN